MRPRSLKPNRSSSRRNRAPSARSSPSSTEGGVTYAAIQSTVGGFNPTTAERVISFTVTFPSAGDLRALRAGCAWARHLQRRQFLLRERVRREEPGLPTPTGSWRTVSPPRSASRCRATRSSAAGPRRATCGNGSSCRRSTAESRRSRVPGRRRQPDPDVPGRGPRRRAVARQVRVRPAGRVLHGVRSRQRPARHDRPAPAAVHAAGPADRDRASRSSSAACPARRRTSNFTAYWNQVTPENAGKWGSVEGTRDVMNWAELDTRLRAGEDQRLPVPAAHARSGGTSSPHGSRRCRRPSSWQEIQEWFAAVADALSRHRLHRRRERAAARSAGRPGRRQLHRRARRRRRSRDGTGCSESFRLARQYFPNAQARHQRVQRHQQHDGRAALPRHRRRCCRRKGLIDTVGVQGHAFSTRVPNCRDDRATWICWRRPDCRSTSRSWTSTARPTRSSSRTTSGSSRSFWEHPAVRGITLWGYRPGHWRTAQGAYIVHENGAERPAMVWLQGYVASTVLRPWITAQPVVADGTVGDDVSFAVRRRRQRRRWRTSGARTASRSRTTRPPRRRRSCSTDVDDRRRREPTTASSRTPRARRRAPPPRSRSTRRPPRLRSADLPVRTTATPRAARDDQSRRASPWT